MRIVVAGGRDFNNTDLVEYAFKQIGIGPNDTVVHGACRGADLLCATIAKLYGAKTEAHPADWKRYGKSAGPVRNREMLQSGVDMLIAFPGGRGTFNAVMTAKSLDVPIWDLREMKWYSASN